MSERQTKPGNHGNVLNNFNLTNGRTNHYNPDPSYKPIMAFLFRNWLPNSRLFEDNT